MIIYKTFGTDSLPRPLWWMAHNFYLLFIFLMLLLSLFVVLITNGMMSGLPFLLWGVVALSVYLYNNRNSRPCRMELRDGSLVITSSIQFAVHDIVIPLEALRLELYKSKYYRGGYSAMNSERYLYFTSAADKNVWVELSAPFYTLGKILDALSQQPDIVFGDRELNFVAQYRKDMETYNNPGRRLTRILVPVVFIGLLILIAYQCSGVSR